MHAFHIQCTLAASVPAVESDSLEVSGDNEELPLKILPTIHRRPVHCHFYRFTEKLGKVLELYAEGLSAPGEDTSRVYSCGITGPPHPRLPSSSLTDPSRNPESQSESLRDSRRSDRCNTRTTHPDGTRAYNVRPLARSHHLRTYGLDGLS